MKTVRRKTRRIYRGFIGFFFFLISDISLLRERNENPTNVHVRYVFLKTIFLAKFSFSLRNYLKTKKLPDREKRGVRTVFNRRRVNTRERSRFTEFYGITQKKYLLLYFLVLINLFVI